MSKTRHPLPEKFVETAQLRGFTDIRFWGDLYTPVFERTLIEKNEQVLAAARSGIAPQGLYKADFLALSGGGDRGAFAAGLLAGWSERGDRPVFEAVTGVSAGALASPFAFLGPSEDRCLMEIYTQHDARDLFRRRGLLGFFGDALADTSKLEELIRGYATEEFLDRIAAEHAKGRRLFVMTTNLDAQRQMIWNLSAIAASGCANRRDLFVSILRASSALPGLFPPVKIDVVGDDGETYDELHVDGGVTAELVFVPPESEILEIERRIFPEPRTRSLYVIENGKLNPEYEAIDLKILPLAARAISTSVKYQVVGNLLALSVIARATEGRFCFNAIPRDFEAPKNGTFDRAWAARLYEAGRDVGRSGHWFRTPPLSPMHELREPDEVTSEMAHMAEAMAAASAPRARSVLSRALSLLHHARKSDGKQG